MCFNNKLLNYDLQLIDILNNHLATIVSIIVLKFLSWGGQKFQQGDSKFTKFSQTESETIKYFNS